MRAVTYPAFHSHFINFLPPVQYPHHFTLPLMPFCPFSWTFVGFFSVLEDCSQQSWSEQPKAALWLLHLPKELWLTVMSSSTSVSLRENQGCPSLFSLFLQPSTLKTLAFAFSSWSHMRGHLESSKPFPRSTQMLCAALLTQVSCACSELHEEGEEKGFRTFFLFPNRFFKSCSSVMNIHFNGVLKTQLDDTSERKWSRNKRN